MWPPDFREQEARDQLARVVEENWRDRLESDPYLRVRHGLPVHDLRAFSLDVTAQRGYSLDQVEAEARGARRALADLREIDRTALTDEDALTWRFLEASLLTTVEAVDNYWFEFPVLGFSATPLTFYLRHVFGVFEFSQPADVELYLHLLREYGKLVDDMATKLAGQLERGIVVPAVAVPAALAVVAELLRDALGQLVASPVRLARLGPHAASAMERIDRQLSDGVAASFARLRTRLTEHAAVGHPHVGLSHYSGGTASYDYAVRLHTTLDITPDEIHRTGRDQVAMLSEQMAEIRSRLRFSGSEADFHAALRRDQRFHVTSPSQLERVFAAHLARIEQHIPDYFAVVPEAAYGLECLDPALSAVMTYGYYEQPTSSQPTGRYRYNTADLEARSLLGSQALIYHELVPGHHFHLARQAENRKLPMIRREAADICAFNEGWAEYAAGLGWEMGLYDDPYQAYGRLIHERLVAQRLVVDTGLNAYGWTLDAAAKYMRTNTLESEIQIGSELVRYGSAHPGQSLGYRIGYLAIQTLRDRLERSLGSDFDVRDFHEAILSEGAMPLKLLDEHVDRTLSRRHKADAVRTGRSDGPERS